MAPENIFDDINCIVNHWRRLRNIQMSNRFNRRRKSELSRVSHEVHMDEHIIPLEQLCRRFNTDLEKGLNPNEAKYLLESNGPNIVTASVPSEELQRFFKNIFDWFNCFLWIGSLMCFITYITEMTSNEHNLADDLYLGCALIGTVLISGTFSYYQEAKSANIFTAFQDLIPRSVIVIRAGCKLTCPATELVVGDLIEIKAGNRVPADIRIIDSQGLKCTNPLLTGDSEPFMRTEECSHLNPFETKNLVFFSTNCVEGTARGIVLRTGDHTLMSKLLIKLFNPSINRSSDNALNNETKSFIRFISIVSIFFGVLMSSISYIYGYTWLNAFIFFVALVVAQIPEGLYPTLSVTLTLAAKRMTSKNCLVKNLETVETIGLTSMILTDKTGVITQNRMIVSHIWANNSIINSDDFYRHLDGKKADLDSPGWRALIRCGCLCNKAEFSAAQARLSPIRRKAIGDPTEIAILQYMEIIVGCVEDYRQNFPKVFEIPFDPNFGYSLSINKVRGGFWLCIKGAPEIIFEKCSSILTTGKVIPFDQQKREYFNDIIEQLGNLGERIIAFCDKFLPLDEYPVGYEFDSEERNFPFSELRFIGLLSLINPPRASVPDAVMKCRSAGIKIIMITGDNPITAKAIARSVGIISDQNQTAEEISKRMEIDVKDIEKKLVKASVVCGDQIDQMCDQELRNVVYSKKDTVLARISPLQKLRVVKCCQKKNTTIAVTGDGDRHLSGTESPNISIALGMSGSDLSKQSADIILLDDNFASIVAGIEEGRVIFDNLKKSICYTLSSKTPVACPFLLYLLLDIPLALSSITILCIDLVTDIIPAISLAHEIPETDIMNNKPREPLIDKLFNNRLKVLAYCYFGAFELFSGFFTYCVILTENGFFAHNLFGIRRQWDSKAINDLMDSYGQEWTYNSRKTLEYTSQTAFFASVVITKWSAIICCKTRSISIFKQKMRNDVLTFSMFFELGLAMFLSYCPGLDKGLHMYPMKFFWWFCSLPFAILMIITDEIRRLIIRVNPKGWLENETYY